MPKLAGTMAFSRKEIDVTLMKKDLTIKYYDSIAEKTTVLHGYDEDKRTLRVPREYGIQYCIQNNLKWKDETSAGESGVWDCGKHPSLRDYQGPWVDGIMAQLETEYDIRAQAATGMGKTVMSLEVARRLDTTTVVMVDQEFLRDQWVDTAKDLFGMSEEDIGIVQGNRCDYEGKTLVIAMVQTLFSREFSQDFYDYFGVAIFDECHTIGAPVFAKTLGMFPAQSRWGVSATPDRNDAKDNLIRWHLAEVEVSLQKKHEQSIVRYVESYGVYSWYAVTSAKTGRYINEIAGDTVRNRLVADAISEMHKGSRTVLALSDRIEHLQVIKYLLIQNGVPAEDIGVVARYAREWRYAKDPSPGVRPIGWDGETPYTPVAMQVTSKKIKSEVLDHFKETKKVLLATYQMFSKGVDVPRIDTGIDMTPRSKAQQQHGRILRVMQGKMTPIWVTVRDVNCSRAEFQFMARLYEYRKSNVEVYQWRLDMGTRKRDAGNLISDAKKRSEQLKQARIVTTPDGRSMLQTQSLLRRPEERPETTTDSRTRRRRAR